MLSKKENWWHVYNAFNLKAWVRVNFPNAQYSADQSHFYIYCLNKKCPHYRSADLNDYTLYFNLKKQIGDCKRCGRKFDLPRLISLQMGKTEDEALDFIYRASKANLKDLKELLGPQIQEEPVVQILRPTVDPPEGVEWDRPFERWPKAYREYCQRIGYTAEIIQKYHIGFCAVGYYQRRIITPWYWGKRQRLVWWEARDITGEADQKVRFAPGSRSSNILFNYRKHWDKGGVVSLVEGAKDAIQTGSLATQSHSISPVQLELVQKLNPSVVVIGFDPDVYSDSLRIAGTLKNYFPRIKVPKLPKDPAKLGWKKYWEIVNSTPDFDAKWSPLMSMFPVA